MTAPRFRHDVVAGRVPGAEPPLPRPDGRPLEVPAAAADLTAADQAALAAHLAARRVAAALDADRVGLPGPHPMTATGYAAGICADRIPPGRAVDRPRPGDRFADATVADLVAVAVAADNARRRRGTLGPARSWAAAGLDDALDRLDNRPGPPTVAVPAGLPAGAGTVTAEPAPAVAFRHAWSAGNRHAAITALAGLFAGTTTQLARADAADLALPVDRPARPMGPDVKGVAYALDLLAARLADPDAGVAAHLTALEVTLGPVAGVPLDDTVPPTAGFALRPALIALYPRARLELDEYPAIILAPQDSTGRHLTDAGPLADTWAIRRRIRIFSLVRGPDVEAAGRGRDRLDLAVDEALHRSPRLADDLVLVPEATIGSLSDVDVDETDGAGVAGAYLEVTVLHADQVDRPPAGTVETVAVTGFPVPAGGPMPTNDPHPALG